MIAMTAAHGNYPISSAPLLPQYTFPAIIVWPLLAALFFFLCLRPVAPGDIYFLMLAGARTLDTGQVPHTDFFLYTVDGQNQLFGGWGFGVLAELCNRMGGLIAVSCFSAALWSATFVLGFMAAGVRLGRKINQPFTLPDITALLFAGAAIFQLVVNRTQQRPEVTAYLIWCLGILLFERDRRNGTRHALLVYPLLVWAEAWLHTAGPILFLLPFGYLIDYIAQRWVSYKAQPSLAFQEIFPWLTSLLLALLLPVLNPNGVWQFYAHPMVQLQELAHHAGIDLPAFMRLSSNDQFISTDHIIEYLPFWRFPLATSLFMSAMAYSVIIVMLTKQRILFLISTVPLAIYAALHVRGLGLLAMALLVPLTALTVSTVHSIDLATKGVNRLRCHGGLIVLLLAGFFAIARHADSAELPTMRPPFLNGLRAIKETFPNGSNVASTYMEGPSVPWLLGNHYKVPFTGHMMFTRPSAERHYVTMVEAKTGWLEELAQHGIKSVAMPTNNIMDGSATPLLTKIAYDPAWRLAATDPEGVTYIKLDEGVALSAHKKLGEIKTYWHVVLDGMKKAGQPDSPAGIRTSMLAKTELQRLSTLEEKPDDVIMDNLAIPESQTP